MSPYANVNNFIVIQADDRDPDVSWEHHLERGSAGGVDCVAPIGTPVYAPADCFVTRIPDNGTGGNTLHMDFGDGWADEFMHFDSYGEGSVGDTKQGEFVGYSGDTGAPGQPHVHWHRIDPDGNRQNPWHYFSSTAGGGSTLIPNTTITAGDIMRYKATSASKDGVIRQGDSFLQGAEGPLRLLGLDETNAYQYNDEHGRPTPYAEWPGEKLRSLVKVAGLRAYDGTGKPTGKIKY